MTHTHTRKHTQAPIPSPKSPCRTHVSYHKGSLTGPNKCQTSSSTLSVPTHGSAAQLDTSGSEHVSLRNIQLGWAIKRWLIRLSVLSCTSGPLCLDRVSAVLWPLELKRLLMAGMWLNYTWIHRATPDSRKECDRKKVVAGAGFSKRKRRKPWKGLHRSAVDCLRGCWQETHPWETLKRPLTGQCRDGLWRAFNFQKAFFFFFFSKNYTTQRDLSEWAPFLPACKQLTLVHSQSVATNDLRGLHMKGIGMRGKKWLYWSAKEALFFRCRTWWENSCLSRRRKSLSLQGIPAEMAIWRGDGSVNMSLSEP